MKKIVPFKKDIIFKNNLSEITNISLEHSLHYEQGHLITGELIVSGEYLMTDSSTNTEPFSFNLPFDINLDERYVIDKAVIDIDDFYYEIVNNNVLSVSIDVLIDKLEEAPLIPEPIIEKIITPELNDQDIEESTIQDKIPEIVVAQPFVATTELEEPELVRDLLDIGDVNINIGVEKNVNIDEVNVQNKMKTDEVNVQNQMKVDEVNVQNQMKVDEVNVQNQMKVDEVNVQNKIKIDEINTSKLSIDNEKEELDSIIPVKSLFDSITDEEEYATYKICIVREGDNIESIMLKYNISKEEISLYNDLKDVKIGDKLIIPNVNAAS